MCSLSLSRFPCTDSLGCIRLCFFPRPSQGTTGKLLSIDSKKMQVVVEGVNIRTKHVKPMKEGESGSLVKKEMPIAISNVALSTEQPAVAAESAE